MKCRVLLLGIMVLLAEVLGASEDAARFALVIGNAAYDGNAALANAANDAGDVADALESIGWKVTRLINGDRKAMNRSIVSFRNDMAGSRNPVALFYYAGHGIQIGGQNYLIPVKETFETADDIANEAVGLQSVLAMFNDAKVSTNIVILDACRDNPFAKKDSRSLGGTRGLSVVTQANNVEGSAVLFATAPGDTAADGTGRNGVFTQALLKYIKSDLSLQVLATKITGEVKRITGGKQSPYSSLSLSDEFFLVPASLRTKAPVPVTAPTVTPTSAPGTVPATATAEDPGLEVKASLILQRTALQSKRKVAASQDGGWLKWAGGILGAVGAGTAGYGFFAANQAAADYLTVGAQSWSAPTNSCSTLIGLKSL